MTDHPMPENHRFTWHNVVALLLSYVVLAFQSWISSRKKRESEA
jgi:hypothetical protein